MATRPKAQPEMGVMAVKAAMTIGDIIAII